ncbi:MAG: hypothetical protein ACE5L7_03555 [Candidatus Aminicenantales bacterium]
MQSPQKIDYQIQIEEALKRAKCKKVLYLYDDYGEKHMLGVFSPKKASQIKKYLQQKKLLNRLSEFEVKTTEPDSYFNFS